MARRTRRGLQQQQQPLLMLGGGGMQHQQQAKQMMWFPKQQQQLLLSSSLWLLMCFSFTLLLLRNNKVLVVYAAVPTNGMCKIDIFLPFTDRFGIGSKAYASASTNSAFTHMSVAFLAMQHFNDRNPDFILRDDSTRETMLQNNCPIQFDVENTRVYDTGTVGHKAVRQFLMAASSSTTSSENDDDDDSSPPPCAIAGPYNDMPALELSTVASALQIPMVVHRAYNQRVVMDEFSPYTSMVWPDSIDTSRFTIDWLRNARNRNDYVGVLYSLSDGNIQLREVLSWALDEAGMTWEAQSMIPVTEKIDESRSNLRNAESALRSIRDRGFRTIIVLIEEAVIEFPEIAQAAETLGMNNGDYFWIWFGACDPALLHRKNELHHKLLYGSAMVVPLEDYLHRGKKKQDGDNSPQQGDGPQQQGGGPQQRSRLRDLQQDQEESEEETSPFWRAWRNANKDFVKLVNDANPIGPNEPGYEYADSDYFRTSNPDFGSGFLYDAVMSIGIGACLAYSEKSNNDINNNTLLTSAEHLRGIRSLKFGGASGPIRFLNREGRSGARVGQTFPWAGFNLLPGEDPPFEATDFWIPENNSTASMWQNRVPFTFADGTNQGPPLRTEPEQNYLSPGLRVLGLSLFGTVVLAASVTMLWVFIRRKHRVLAASQPFFLYLLAFGCIVQASAIFAMSFDESVGWSEQGLSAGCMAISWLFILGHILVYGALACKLYRVNKVLQFARRKIDMKSVIWPLAVLFLVAVILLTVWTVLDPCTWERTVINETTGESIGQCSSADVFLAPLVVVILIPTILTGIMAWKTKDVSEDFSEARWIWILIVVQLEVVLVAAPSTILLRDVSTDGRYLGSVFMLWIFPMSALLLIVFPKFLAYRRAVRGITETQPKRGDSIGTVRVSGMNSHGFHSSNNKSNFDSASERPAAQLDSQQTNDIVVDKREEPPNDIGSRSEIPSSMSELTPQSTIGN